MENVLIVGSGRAAKHFGNYLEKKSIPILRWSRKDAADFNSESLSLRSEQRLERVAKKSETVIIAISDDSIEDFVKLHGGLFFDHDLFHLSGSIFTGEAVGVHPLMTFAGEDYPLTTYEKIPLVIDTPSAVEHPLWQALPNPKYLIKPHDKALYHTLCALIGNLPSLVWKKSLDLADSQLKLSPQIFAPFMRQLVENMVRDRAHALTGPVARRDFKTLEKHLEVLEGTELEAIYREYISAGLA